MVPNIYAAWIGFFIGCIAGAIPGLFFYGETWLGGYGSWQRRMVRLGHISFFGIGFINMAFAVTAGMLHIETALGIPSALLIIGAVTMPLVCYLSAWKARFRHLFFIPATSLTSGIGLFLWRISVL